jgi:DNA modification methylase
MSQNIAAQHGSTRVPGKTNGTMKAVGDTALRSKRDVWHITTKPFKEAHFAVFPEDLVIPCVLAGCPEDGVVIDPFFGSGTSGVVAKKLGRKFIGIDLNPTYCDIANRRIQNLVSA